MDTAELRQRYGVTKKEAAILAVLFDGQTHSRDELQKDVLKIKHGCTGLVAMHIYRMKPKLRPHGVLIGAVGRGRSSLGWKLVLTRAQGK